MLGHVLHTRARTRWNMLIFCHTLTLPYMHYKHYYYYDNFQLHSGGYMGGGAGGISDITDNFVRMQLA
jgi:hypothetical protein